ncbi:glycoside hydrolase family 26 protein [Gordonia ajococcus]|uniref:glycoside hydrolase family 26 protein n=1 Tax=Gordonia ajococcus TaxID=1292359 RepID=UPI0017812895|nr:glycosyl hydrolase [Gordonia ajococcus]
MPSELGARLPRRAFLMATMAAAIAGAASCSADHNGEQEPLESSRSWGAFVPGVAGTSRSTFASIERLATLAGSKPSFVHLFAATQDLLPVAALDLVRGSGSTPILSLEPWRPDAGRNQPGYSLAAISTGQHDSDLSRWATQLAAWPHPLLLRFAQEMNGTWYPWSVGVNTNTAADYRKAWSRMHSIVSSEAPHVRFVWAPNAITEGTRDFTDCYPGDGVVDYLGLDGYNWGQSPGHQWQSADKLFSNSLKALSRISPGRPILVTEVGSADGATPNLKAQWIADFFRVIENHPDVLGFLWFQMDKERDWRFNSTLASTKSFRDELAQWMSSGRPT